MQVIDFGAVANDNIEFRPWAMAENLYVIYIMMGFTEEDALRLSRGVEYE